MSKHRILEAEHEELRQEISATLDRQDSIREHMTHKKNDDHLYQVIQRGNRYQLTARTLNKYGVHARPAFLIVRAASLTDIDIYARVNGNKVNAKSIMGLMTLEAEYDTDVFFEARVDTPEEGEQVKVALKEISDLFEKGFGEL